MARSRFFSWMGILVFALTALSGPRMLGGDKPAAAPPDWAMNATIIEACSCPMFCQCYFNAKPSGHAGHEGHATEHFCKFNNAFKVNTGNYGKTNLAGAKFWASGDLGDNFGDGQIPWMVVTFDPAVSKEQREGIAVIMSHVYPVKPDSFSAAEAPIEWKATKDRAEARLNGGKDAEVILTRFKGMTDEPVVIRNLPYFGAPRNDGFIMMPNEVEAYRIGDKPYEFRGTNGFMITFDIKSSDFKAEAQKGGS